MESKEFLTLKETAQLLGRTPKSVRELVYRGVLPAVRLGRMLYVKRSDLEKAFKPVAPRLRA